MFDNMVRNYRSWRKYRATYTELMRLSSDELKDIGLQRGDIPFAARRASR
ncbi:MAG: DUF1127 domain-containing protein [Hyphomicrobiales bacterium]|nr:MAG: DUF1127 domain-containing protein [Hyphomicrobiales bacterium]